VNFPSPAGHVPPGYETEQVLVDHESAVAYASSAARRRARRLALPDSAAERAAVIASELASNIRKHAGRGFLLVGPAPDPLAPDPAPLDVIAIDHGPGMTDVSRCLDDGYSTAGTLGAGLGAVRRMASQFAAWSRPGEGTVIWARLAAPAAARPRGPVSHAASICLPAYGAGPVGDGYCLTEAGGTVTALIVDGLGHGPAAAAAAEAAIGAFRARAGEPLPALIAGLHQELRGTRGAAALAVRIGDGWSESCGVGNTYGVILSGGGSRARLSGQPGILGARLPAALQARRHPFPPGAVLVACSDGIAARWPSHMDTSQLLQPPALLAALVTARYRRDHDDATVLALSAAR
jgi:anti-sigma regulatory factor (Ser/Thr protein kinase)